MTPCTCLPIPEPPDDICPVHGEDGLCDCEHSRHAHFVTNVSNGDNVIWQEWCGACSCIDFSPPGAAG